jgi:Zn-dependent M28 family amino/carboxypeptidase
MGAVTARLSFDVSRDPCPPEFVFFIRSEQYSFVKQGIPSVFLSAGTKSSVPNIATADHHEMAADYLPQASGRYEPAVRF